MKRILYYSLLAFQAAVILLITVQHALINVYGTEIKLLEEDSIQTDNYYQPNYQYLEYEINRIDDEIWDIEDELNWKEKVYVVLKLDESEIFNAVRVTLEKPEAAPNEVILLGRYKYTNEAERKHYVDYDIERMDNDKLQDQLSDKDQSIITVMVAPWGQKTVVAIDNK